MTTRRPSGSVPAWPPPSSDPFDAAIERARRKLPPLFRRHIADIVFQTPDFADSETLFSMGIESPWNLLGLYSGIPVGDRSVGISGGRPDIIFLYREPIRAHAEAQGETLEAVIQHVLIHEIGHHFGLSDEDMEKIEQEAAEAERLRQTG